MHINPVVSVRVISGSLEELHVNATVPGELLAVGVAYFERCEDGQVRCQIVDVNERYRRQGIATALYAQAEEHFGKPVVPSTKLTFDSVAFWESRGVAIPVEAEVKSYSTWFDLPEEGDDGEEMESEEDDPLRVRRPSSPSFGM